MGDAAATAARRYAWEAVAAEVTEVYRAALASPAGGAGSGG
jgi:hypothetical protein